MFMNGPVGNFVTPDQAAHRWREIDKGFMSNDLPVPGYGNQHPLPPNVRLNHILTHPSLEVRATDLGYFVTYSSVDDLKGYFPIILETIFGFKNNYGWGLRMLTKQHSMRDADAVMRFLSPADGPLFNLTYRLMEDTNLRYEYPVGSLPKPLADKLLSGDVPSFFTNKINTAFTAYGPYNPAARNSASKCLLLNPFEYFFMYFTISNVVGVPGEYGGSYLTGWGSSADSVYSNLLEEYLAFFFPCDGRGVPAASYIHVQTNDATYISSQASIHRVQRDSQGNVLRRPSMFKDSVFQDQGDGGILTREKTYHQPYSQKETWRSDAILHLCMELWMNVEVREDLNRIIFDLKLPSVDLVKSVRMLVRHVHYFTNNINNVALHPMEDIKRLTFPIFQKKLYQFLKDLFQRWPMDNSFRIVYETWLSYIQPWRYLQYSRNYNSKNRDISEHLIDNRWYGFMMENILFYTTLFLHLVPRFQRVDLTTPKNALMLFRVAKIYTISDKIRMLLREIEKNLEMTPIGYSWNGADLLTTQHGTSGGVLQRSGVYSNSSLCAEEKIYNGVGLGTSSHAHKVVLAKQMLKDLESAQFVYTPLFCQATKDAMKKILVSVQQASDALGENVDKYNGGAQNSQGGWLQWFSATLWIPDLGPTVPEKIKAFNQLEFAKLQLCTFFEIPPEEVINSALYSDTYGNMSQDNSSSESLSSPTPSTSRLPNVGSKILRSGLPSPIMMTTVGNPDDALPRQDESKIALKVFNGLSSKINRKYGAAIEQNYFSRSIRGRICRAIFAKPQEFYTIDKKKGQRPSKVRMFLPPRANLRFLASTRTLYVVLALIVGCIYFRLSIVGGTFWGLMFGMLYVICRAIRDPTAAELNFDR